MSGSSRLVHPGLGLRSIVSRRDRDDTFLTDLGLLSSDHVPMSVISPEDLLAPFAPDRRETANALRSLVRRAVPDAIEAVRPGWGLIGYDVPAGRRSAYFAFVWPEIEHVHLGFEYGILVDDPGGALQGIGKKVRYVTIRQPGEIVDAVLEDLVRSAARVAKMTRSERVALLIDRDIDS